MQRLTESWRAELERWQARDLSDVDYVYIWADGVYPRVRLAHADGQRDPLCLLVIVGAGTDGTKELVAVVDGYRESTESWAEVLRDLRDRGTRSPELAVGDGALGLWAALNQVWPATRHQRCWVHKTAGRGVGSTSAHESCQRCPSGSIPGPSRSTPSPTPRHAPTHSRPPACSPTSCLPIPRR